MLKYSSFSCTSYFSLLLLGLIEDEYFFFKFGDYRKGSHVNAEQLHTELLCF